MSAFPCFAKDGQLVKRLRFEEQFAAFLNQPQRPSKSFSVPTPAHVLLGMARC